MRIYVDFDDVLCETARALSSLAAAMFGRTVPYERIQAFDLQTSFDINKSQYHALMARAHEPVFLLGLAPTPGGSACLRRWRKTHEVVIVTGRPATCHAPTKTWLHQAGLEGVAILHVDKYGRHHDTSPDAPPFLTLAELRRETFDLAIDDAPLALDVLRARPTGRTVIFDRPWNRAYTSDDPRLCRCRDWKELAGIIDQ